MSRAVRLAGILALAIAAACGPATVERTIARTQTFAIPERRNTSPGLAVLGDQVAIVWTATREGGGADVYAAVSTDAGATFAAPVRVNDHEGAARATGEQAPRVAIGRQRLVVVWPEKRENKSEVAIALSRDGGRTFGPSRTVHPAGATGARGWASLAIDQTERAHVLWLDGRNAVATGGHVHGPDASHGTPAPSSAVTTAASAMGDGPRQDLFRATIDLDGRIDESLVAANVCFCCKTAIAFRPDGTGITAWRHIFPEHMRDIAVAALPASGPPSMPIGRVSEDHWQIDACPDDGPSVATDPAGSVSVIWPTLVAGQQAAKGIFFASSTDGFAFSPRVRLDEGGSSASHPQLTVTGNGTLAAVWDEPADGTRRVVLRRYDTARREWQPAETLGSGGWYPSVASAGHTVLVAWGATPSFDHVVLARVPKS